MIPDAEKAIGDYLRGVLDTRVAGESPASVEDSWVRVTLIDDAATDGGRANRHFACYVQIDCFAGRSGTQATARALAVEVRNHLAVMHEQALDDVVVSGAETRMSRQPDTSFEPEMQCYSVTGTVWMRAA